MTSTPKENINSPCCENKVLSLGTHKITHIFKRHMYFGEFYVYSCECGKTYTTTESDELSLKNLKQKKL